MPTYLEHYLADEREAVWEELNALRAASRDEPLFADAQAVARETMRRARANVELLVGRLSALGYRFVDPATGTNARPYEPPSEESLASLRELEAQYGLLPLSIETWYEVVGTVDLTGVYPRLSSYAGIGAEGYVDMMWGGEVIRVRSPYPFYARGISSPRGSAGPEEKVASDPLVIYPCIDALVDELEEVSDGESDGEPRVRYSLGFAPDALTKANISGGDGPHIDFGDPRMDAPLHGDDWEGVPFVSYLRTVFEWGGFPGLREASDPPRELLASLCEGLLPL